jgi:hypothetical protein
MTKIGLKSYGRSNRKSTAPFVAFNGTASWFACAKPATQSQFEPWPLVRLLVCNLK